MRRVSIQLIKPRWHARRGSCSYIHSSTSFVLFSESVFFFYRNNVDVPDDLKTSLIETLEEHRCASHTEYLAEKKHERESFVEPDIITEFQELLQKLKYTMPQIDVRVKNGSYTVTNYRSEDIRPFKKEDEVDEDSRHRAKQKIQTVQTESPFYKLVQCVLKCIFNNGNVRGVKQERVVMEGVNLALAHGKMYLVL